MVHDVLTAPSLEAPAELAQPIACPFEASRLELVVESEPTEAEIAAFQAWEVAVGRVQRAIVAHGLGQAVCKGGLGLMAGMTGSLFAMGMAAQGLRGVALTFALILARQALASVQGARIADLIAAVEAMRPALQEA